MGCNLGIDVGTSKVAAVLWDTDRGESVGVHSVEHEAAVSGLPEGWAEQDVGALLDAVAEAVARLSAEQRAQVQAVGLTGQMHGILLLGAGCRPLSRLITWQDQRCLGDGFLAGLRRRTGAAALHAGYGCATLAWLAAHDAVPPETVSVAAIHDFVAARICGLRQPVTDPTDAASLGLFDVLESRWREDWLDRAGVSASLLPRVQPCGSPAGRLAEDAARDLGLPVGVPVMTPIGDNQASVWASVHGRAAERVLALTLGTGGQLSAVMPADFRPESASGPTFEYRPFPGPRFAAVAATLSGGAAMAWLADVVRDWCTALGVDAPPRDDLFARLSDLGLRATGGGLEVRPHFAGERHAPESRGRIAGIGLTGFSLGNVARALARGVVANLRAMLPPECLAGRTTVVGSGNAVRRLPLLRGCIEEVMGLPLELRPDCEEAALGAAMLAEALQ